MTGMDPSLNGILAQPDRASLTDGDDAVMAPKKVIEHLELTRVGPLEFPSTRFVHQYPH